ncbi:MAG: tetratricopeptide repeat protein, partial [Candidatus Krumholzibacteriota bacterium]|nr:tetratricopeptide repeat protein [Candidatus Krumholzibacteriota bacterium]
MNIPALETIESMEERIAASPPECPERVDLMNQVAWRLWGRDMERSRDIAFKAYEMAQRIGDERGMAYSKRSIGLFQYGSGEIEEALKLLNEALTWFDENDDQRGLADVRTGLSYVYWGFGDFRTGFEMAEAALAGYEKLQAWEGQGWALSALGTFYHDFKDHRRSLEFWKRANEIFVATESITGQARTLNGIGNAHHLLGEHERALEFQDESVLKYAEVDDQFGVAKTFNDIGLILKSLGRLDEALTFHRRALDVRAERKYAQGECTCMLDIADILIMQRDYDGATEQLNRALVLAERVRSKTKQRTAHELFSRLYRDLGKFDVAIVHFENYHRLTEEVYLEDAEQKLNNMKAAHEIEASAKEAEIYRLRTVELGGKNEEL